MQRVGSCVRSVLRFGWYSKKPGAPSGRDSAPLRISEAERRAKRRSHAIWIYVRDCPEHRRQEVAAALRRVRHLLK